MIRNKTYIAWDDNDASSSSEEEEENLCLMVDIDEDETKSNVSDSFSESNTNYDNLLDAFKELHEEAKLDGILRNLLFYKRNPMI